MQRIILQTILIFVFIFIIKPFVCMQIIVKIDWYWIEIRIDVSRLIRKIKIAKEIVNFFCQVPKQSWLYITGFL